MSKGNMVADALSRKRLSLSSLFVERRSLEFISKFDFRPSVDFVPGLLASLEVRPTLGADWKSIEGRPTVG